MGSILLKDITIADERKDVFIDKGRIVRIRPEGSCVEWDIAGDCEVMDCSGKVAIPGFINMHTHAGMSLMRGIGEDMLFHEWLDKIWKIEAGFDYDYVYWAAKVACVEMIRTGTTTFNDQYWYFQACQKAAAEMGIRPAVGYDIMDRNDPEEALRQMDQCQQKYEEVCDLWNKDGAIYELAFHAIYSVSEPMMIWAADFARKHDLPLHIHLSETRKEVEDCKAAHGGLSPVEYLDSIGVLGPNLLAAHCLWISDHDIELLARHGVHCIHNINSNAKLSSGYHFRYEDMHAAGINICIGTDGCASSNNLDLLEAMKTSALFQKAWTGNPKALPLNELLDMATINGAKALRLESGRLEEGALADISIVETDSSYFLSPAPFLANLVYSAHSDCIDSVIANGRFVMRNREIPDEKEVLHEARQALSKIKTA